MLKHLSRIVSAVLLAGAVSVVPAAAADLQAIIASGKVRIGVPVDVPPFGSVDANNEADRPRCRHGQGDRRSARRRAGTAADHRRQPRALPRDDRLDIVIAAMGATPERALQIAFTSPYAALSSGVFGPDSIAVSSPADLTDQTIAVARGTTQDLLADRTRTQRQYPALRRRCDGRRRLPLGQAQLLATADVVAKDLMDKNPGAQLKPKFIMEFSPCYIGIQQGSPELLRWLDTYIHVNLRNGTLSALSEKWIGTPLPSPFPSI
jgi:polar amino acid transport system substrate-binding protein